MFKIKKLVMLLTLSLFCVYGCSKDEVLSPELDSAAVLQSSNKSAASKGKVVHHVNLGTNDACEALGLPNGCDGNFSLVANMFEDGSVKGQWQDTFNGGGEGIHVAIDCMTYGEINGAKYAIVSGTITKGKIGGVDVTGESAVTAVVDNIDGVGQDLMSFSYNSSQGVTGDCNTYGIFQFQLLPVGTGQAKVW